MVDRNFYPLRVLAVEERTADSRSLVLEIPPNLASAFHYRAGQFCTVRAPFDGGHVYRSYSMSSAPEYDEPFSLTVKRVPGGGVSAWLTETVRAGDVLEWMAPAGRFVLRDATTPLVLFAGGSGITPIYSIIKSALAQSDRPIVLVYANRDVDSVIFGPDLETLANAHPHRLTLRLHLDSISGFLDPPGCVELCGPKLDADFYICGPGPFMETVEKGLGELGIGPDQIFIERFLAPDDDESDVGPVAAGELVVRLDGATHTLDYREDETVLVAARRAGLNPPYSCTGGDCATCIAKLEAGAARMKVNNILSPAELEGGWILMCQAVPLSEALLVDYDVYP